MKREPPGPDVDQHDGEGLAQEQQVHEEREAGGGGGGDGVIGAGGYGVG